MFRTLRLPFTLTLLASAIAASFARPPEPWQEDAIGEVRHRGGFQVEKGLWRINGAGNRIGEKSDHFYFVWQAIEGDTTMVAHFARGLEFVDPMATAGLMIRSSFEPGAKMAYMGVTSMQGVVFRARAQADGGATEVRRDGKYTSAQKGPGVWLRLERRGDTITGAVSEDGQTFQEIGRTAVDLSGTALVGLAITSRNPGYQYGFAWFDKVNISGTPGEAPARPKGPEAIAPPDEPPAAQPGVDVIEVLFGEEPVERGLTFDRTAVKPAKVKLRDKVYQSWVADRSADPGAGWARSFRFRVTDPRFQNGGRPAGVVEVTYHLPTWAGVHVKADTKSGGREIGSGWGNTSNWQTVRINFDDAYFGGREHGSEGPLPVDGFDLRIDGANAGLYLRRVRIIGYDPKQNIAWDRMVKVQRVTADTEGGILAFPRGKDQKLTVDLRNLAYVPRDIHYTLTIRDAEKIVHQGSGSVRLKEDSRVDVPLLFDTGEWPLGPYTGSLDIRLEEGDETPLFTREMHLGVVSDARLAKARPGEYLYGLDTANNTIFRSQDETGLAYFRLMGVDLIRNLHDKGEKKNLEDTGRALERLAAQGVQAMMGMDPPKQPKAADRAKELQNKTNAIREIAKAHAGRGPGRIHFFELGNEPDLKFFFPGPIPEYLEGYYALYDAIKEGAMEAGLAKDGTMVMNGGLSFAGPEGDKRSRELIRLVDPEKIDAIAYHAHGRGIGAQRMAYERVLGVAGEYGKADRPFIDTESGFSAQNEAGLLVQARSVVEKIVFAQSVGMPTLMFFRLFMEGTGSEGGYGLTQNRVEPRPSVLSYRHLVERLRHHVFAKTLDFDGEAGTDGVGAFLFEGRDDRGMADGRMALVLFSEKPARHTLNVQLAAADSKVGDLRVYDLWGNRSPATLMDGNVASLEVGVDPVYLVWDNAGPAAEVAVAKPLLSIRTDEPLLAGATTKLPVTVRNPSATPLKAQVTIQAHARVPVTVTPGRIDLEIPGDATVERELEVKLGDAAQPLAMPRWWKVFLDADHAELSSDQLAEIPTMLGDKSGEFVWTERNRIDFGSLAGSVKERRPAMAYAVIDSPTDVELPVAASADWWMAWYVNGRKVYDTLEKGNQHRTLADQPFALPLKAGRNVVAVAVLSGSGGWTLDYGGPKELQLATETIDPDRLELKLSSGGGILARQLSPLQIRGPVPLLGEVGDLNEPKSWNVLEPLLFLAEQEVENSWMKEPDQTRWYKGETDLSAKVWLRDGGDRLHLAVAVRDDVLVQSDPASGRAISDHLLLRVFDDLGAEILNIQAGMVDGKMTALTSSDAVSVSGSRDDADSRTFYHLSWPKGLVGNSPFRLSVSVTDNDAGYVKQTLESPEPHGIRLRTTGQQH